MMLLSEAERDRLLVFLTAELHLLSPRVLEAALSSGVTTVIGQEIGPVWGVGLNSPWLLRRAFGAFDRWPVNVGFLARGSSSHPGPLVEGLAAGGAGGFKVHEDLGAHPRCLDTALSVADEHDVQVALHTDGLNEAGGVDDTLAVAGRHLACTSSDSGIGGPSRANARADPTTRAAPIAADLVVSRAGSMAYKPTAR